MKRLFVFVTMSLLLTSCGGGGGNTVSTFETPTLTAYYVDAPVKGLIYEASPSGLSGVTDERGAFNFKQGDLVSFYIDPVNRIYIGKVQPISEQIVIPLIANIFDPEVDTSLVYLILYSLDMAQIGAAFMDISNLLLSSSTAEKIRMFLSKRQIPNQIIDVWQSMSSIQSEASNYTFRNSGGGLSKSNHRQHLYDSASIINSLKINTDDFSGVYAINIGFQNIFIHFATDGVIYSLGRDGSIGFGEYSINQEVLTYRWIPAPNNECDIAVNLKQRGSQWSVVTFQEVLTPIGCNSSPRSVAYSKARVNQSIDISHVSGKTLRIPSRGLCSFGEGDTVFSISSIGLAANQRNVDVSSSACINNSQISGVVKESGVPGVLVFEFDNMNPKTKFFFSVLEQSGRALTQTNIEQTVPTTRFDFLYGAETTYILE